MRRTKDKISKSNDATWHLKLDKDVERQLKSEMKKTDRKHRLNTA